METLLYFMLYVTLTAFLFHLNIMIFFLQEILQLRIFNIFFYLYMKFILYLLLQQTGISFETTGVNYKSGIQFLCQKFTSYIVFSSYFVGS